MANVGRPTKYSQEIQDKTVAYLEERKRIGKVPTAAGLSLELGVNKSTLYEWAKHHDVFSNTLNDINALQEKILVEGALDNKLNATIAKLMLANHGYSDKQQTDITSGGDKLSPVMVKFMGDDKTKEG